MNAAHIDGRRAAHVTHNDAPSADGTARHRGPRRPRVLVPLLLAALTLLVTACTGTREEQSSTLLVAGTVQSGTPELILVEDGADGTAATERVRFVAGSRRPLQAPAVSIDVTSRELGRTTAWVLAREVTGSAVSAYLHAFNVSDIDVAAPTAFAELGTALTLVAPGGGGILPPAETTNAVICPTAVQASRDGSWLLVLDVPTECVSGTSGFPVVWLVNTVAGTATSLQATTPELVVGAGPYTDQSADDERGYFLVAGTTASQVFATDFEDATTGWFGSRLLQVDPTRVVALAGSGSKLVALADGQLVGVDLGRPAGAAPLGPVQALSNGRALVTDPLGRLDHVLVVGPTQVQVHSSVSDDAPDAGSVSVVAAAATIDAFRAFAYLVVNGAVVTLDLYTGGASGEQLRSHHFDVPELVPATGPNGRPVSAITWVRAADPPVSP